MKKTQIISDICLTISVLIIIFYANELVFKPLNDPYEFQTVSKISNLYDEPIFLTFYWETDDELQVGKLIKLNIEANNIPYSIEDEPLEPITIHFDERQINYWNKHSSDPEIRILNKDYVELAPDWSKKSFISNEIKIRFIIPENIHLNFCDSNLGKCMQVDKIIHPAPHDLAVQIDTNRIGIGISLLVAIFSCIIIWSKIRPE